MSASTRAPAAEPPTVRAVSVGDQVQITGRVVKVRGNAHMALVQITGGSFYVPLPGPNALPDDQVVVISRAPAPQRVVEVRAGCSTCGA